MKALLFATATSLALLTACATTSATSPQASGHTPAQNLTQNDDSNSEPATVERFKRMDVQATNSPRGLATDLSCDQVGWTDDVSPQHQSIINQMMGSHDHRVHHALWHAVRGGVDKKTSLLVDHSYGMSWNLPHPLCPAPQDNATDAHYNPAGEDFLFMHRQMLEGLRQAFMRAGLKCVRGWSEVPSESQAALPDSDRTDAKSDAALSRMRGWESFFQSDEWLKGKSLSEVGFALEFSIHNNLHMRYATTAPPVGFNEIASVGGAPLPMNNVYPAGWKYDSAKYNWLADPYGAAVNPTFWKIHGYVDDVINHWLISNGYSRAAIDCTGDRKCYQWQGKWTGSSGSLNSHLHAMMVNDQANPLVDGPTEREPATADATSNTPIDDDTAAFTRQRMARQHLGVIRDAPPTRGMPKAGAEQNEAPQDPYEYVKGSVCKDQR